MHNKAVICTIKLTINMGDYSNSVAEASFSGIPDSTESRLGVYRELAADARKALREQVLALTAHASEYIRERALKQLGSAETMPDPFADGGEGFTPSDYENYDDEDDPEFDEEDEDGDFGTPYEDYDEDELIGRTEIADPAQEPGSPAEEFYLHGEIGGESVRIAPDLDSLIDTVNHATPDTGEQPTAPGEDGDIIPF